MASRGAGKDRTERAAHDSELPSRSGGPARSHAFGRLRLRCGLSEPSLLCLSGQRRAADRDRRRESRNLPGNRNKFRAGTTEPSALAIPLLTRHQGCRRRPTGIVPVGGDAVLSDAHPTVSCALQLQITAKRTGNLHANNSTIKPASLGLGGEVPSGYCLLRRVDQCQCSSPAAGWHVPESPDDLR